MVGISGINALRWTHGNPEECFELILSVSVEKTRQVEVGITWQSQEGGGQVNRIWCGTAVWRWKYWKYEGSLVAPCSNCWICKWNTLSLKSGHSYAYVYQVILVATFGGLDKNKVSWMTSPEVFNEPSITSYDLLFSQELQWRLTLLRICQNWKPSHYGCSMSSQSAANLNHAHLEPWWFFCNPKSLLSNVISLLLWWSMNLWRFWSHYLQIGMTI